MVVREGKGVSKEVHGNHKARANQEQADILNVRKDRNAVRCSIWQN